MSLYVIDIAIFILFSGRRDSRVADEPWQKHTRKMLFQAKGHLEHLLFNGVKTFKYKNTLLPLLWCIANDVDAIYRCISINYNDVEKFIYFNNSTQIVKIVY